MVEALRHPPRGFEDLVGEHFWRKKWHILNEMAGWLREAKVPGGLPLHYQGENRGVMVVRPTVVVEETFFNKC